VFKPKVDDPIADLRRAVAGFRPGQERLAASRGAMAADVKRTTAQTEPLASVWGSTRNSFTKVPSWRNTWMRSLTRSQTYSRP
jgi:hypothetical protein